MAVRTPPELHAADGAGRPSVTSLLVLVVLEAVSLAGFAVSAAYGRLPLAALCLFGGFQILVWAYAIQHRYRLLMFFALLFPLTAVGLLPYSYVVYVLYLGNLLLLVALSLTAFVDYPRQDRVSLARLEWLPLAILGLWAAVSALHAVRVHLTPSPVKLLSATGLVIAGLLFAYFFAVVPRSTDQVRRLLIAAAAICAFTCPIILILSVVAGSSLGGKTLIGPLGGYINLNAFAIWTEVFGLVVIGLLLDSKEFRQRVILVCLLAVLLAGLVYSKSRGGWLGFGIAFLYVLLRTKSVRMAVLSAALLTALLSVDFFRSGLISRAQDTTLTDPSLLGRLTLWSWAWKTARIHWLFGVGMENYRFFKHTIGFPGHRALGSVYNAHNIYLELLADLGVVGLLSYVWANVSVFLRLDRTVCRRDLPGRGLAIGLNAALITYAIHGLWDCLTWTLGGFVILGIILGLCISMRRLLHTGVLEGTSRF